MKQDIYPQRSQVAAEVLASAAPTDVLIVPIDFAKKEHVVQMCLGTGRFLFKRPLTVKNTAAGAEYLLQRIAGACRQAGVSHGNVLIGGEDPPDYTVNFVQALTAARYHFVRVNAAEAKKYRTNTRATSDALALNGIVQAVLCRRSYDLAAMDEVYCVMKASERTRHRLVCQETAAKNRIHRSADLLFPGFLNETASGLTPFTETTLDLMADDFSVMKVRRTRAETLVRRFRAHRIHRPEKAAATLKDLAARTLPPPPDIVPYHSRSLAVKVGLLRGIRGAIRAEENEMARCLVQSPGCLLTSFPGIGVVLAAGVVAEYGDPCAWPCADRMASYAGIVPRQHQTGGPEQEAVVGTLPMDANRRLKDWLLQAAFHLGTTPHPAWARMDLPGPQHVLHEHYQAAELRGARSRLSTAKRFLKIARAMVRDHTIYLPVNALDPDAPDALPLDAFVEYRTIAVSAMTAKWRGYDLSGIPDENNWLKRLQEETHALTAFRERHHN